MIALYGNNLFKFSLPSFVGGMAVDLDFFTFPGYSGCLYLPRPAHPPQP